MDTFSFPLAAESLLPHKGFMCCIDKLLTATPTTAVAELVLAPGHCLLNGDVLTPAGYVELAAQAAGVMQGFDKQRQNLPPQSAYLVGVQDFNIFDCARVGECLEMHVNLEAELGEISVLAVEVRRGTTTLATGRLKVYAPER